MMRRYDKYHFKGQHADERILRIIHRHWFNIALHYAGLFFAAIFLIGGSAALRYWLIVSPTDPLFQGLTFLESTAALFFWFYGFMLWIDYYFDVWIVTNQRIVNIEQKGLFVRDIAELQISRVQDVTSEIRGLIPTLLDFGDVYVQTAGEQRRFVFRQIPNPNQVRDAIIQLSQPSLPQASGNLVRLFGGDQNKPAPDTFA